MPKGAAGEYSEWAANFYCGCSNGCTYCYLLNGVFKNICGQKYPQLKSFPGGKNEAIHTFKSELLTFKDRLKNGLFFSFTTDPLLPETIDLTLQAVDFCQQNNVPVKILTKRGDQIDAVIDHSIAKDWNLSLVAIGMTLTGCDDLEVNAPRNTWRINSLALARNHGFRTFASIEPIPVGRFAQAFRVIKLSYPFVQQYKIGLESKRKYNKHEVIEFIGNVNSLLNPVNNPFIRGETGVESCCPAIYWKDSILKCADISRQTASQWVNSVPVNYNLFEHNNKKFLEKCNLKHMNLTK